MDGHILSTQFGIDDDNLLSLVDEAKDYAFSRGMTVRDRNLSMDVRIPAAFCLVPSSFPRKWFNLVKDIQTDLNLLLHKISYSKEFIKECLSSVIRTDEFISNIFKIFEAVEKEGQLSLSMIRSDYLLNTDSRGKITGIKQIESNTISAGFGSLAPVIRDLHIFILDKLGQKGFEDKLPVNDTAYNLARGLVSAWDAYGNENAVILFIVETVVLNICDQRVLEYSVMEYESAVKVLRCTFKELRTCAVLKNKTLWVKGKEVAVVYYRTGYMPRDYEPEDWEVRLTVERSKAIKCPSAGMHLAGTKKVQLYLNKPGVLERFVDEGIAENIRELFTDQYALDKGPEGDEAISKAIDNPYEYVLKPEREGGGNNLYDDDVKTVLQAIQNSDERNSYILMKRVNAPVIPNCIIRKDVTPEIGGTIGEIGIFGCILGSKDDIHGNSVVGHLLRSKEVTSKECGIAAGFGALDSPYLE